MDFSGVEVTARGGRGGSAVQLMCEFSVFLFYFCEFMLC
jgi:hypothetical protein